jgi:hypothetical protein
MAIIKKWKRTREKERVPKTGFYGRGGVENVQVTLFFSLHFDPA